MSLNVLSLFAGIGGLELGFERAGMTVVGQVEIDPNCRRVLARHWPGVPRHDDVRTFTQWWDSEPRPTVDVVCGGFPCQPFSTAGRKHGTADERWGWPWMADVVRAVRPRFVVGENVARLVRDAEAFGWILGDLHELGFDAEWSTITACSVGAPHVRRRLFLVAYPNSLNGQAWLGPEPGIFAGWQGWGAHALQRFDAHQGSWRDRVDWSVETAGLDGRDADGSAPWLVKAGGNAVVPQVSELIGRQIMASVLERAA